MSVALLRTHLLRRCDELRNVVGWDLCVVERVARHVGSKHEDTGRELLHDVGEGGVCHRDHNVSERHHGDIGGPGNEHTLQAVGER